MRASVLVGLMAFVASVRAEDGYRLWLRYEAVEPSAIRAAYLDQLNALHVADSHSSTAGPMVTAAGELERALRKMLGVELRASPTSVLGDGITLGLTTDPSIAPLVTKAEQEKLGREGYLLRVFRRNGHAGIVIAANTETGVLYGAFALLRHVEMREDIARLDELSAPAISRRVLDHWDNLNGTVERGYAGRSIWAWSELPDQISPRYRDYARANASIGINGCVLNNVNADATILTRPYLRKVAAIAAELRRYGIRVYLTARFSSPIEIGGLRTADPRDPAVRVWWRDKVAEIYRLIPDFGGFLVKANSEGQPGPQTYGRTHAEGANLLADTLAPHAGIVMWRAFVYGGGQPSDDRAKQAYEQFVPLNGKFRANVVVQVKNGPIDFMPREPFHPLFGAMPATNLGLELQITQEYLGQATEVAFLAPLWKECLDSDTYRPGPGATVARVVEGSYSEHPLSLIAGVSNIGNDHNWTGHPLAAANWYAFGRLAWNPTLTSAAIADEWVRTTFSNDGAVRETVTDILLRSREAVVNYSMPLGLHHIMAEGTHFGPGPWVDGSGMGVSTYYHRAGADGIGFDRTATGSDAVSQYAGPVARRWADLATCPDEFLLWFHHLPWDYRMRSGLTLWDELCRHYQAGFDAARSFRREWAALSGRVDPERYNRIGELLAQQQEDAQTWKDACISYFATFSRHPVPAGVEPPAHSLSYFVTKNSSEHP